MALENIKIAEYLSEQKIKELVLSLGDRINSDYKGSELYVVGILSGGFVFCADLIRAIKIPVIVDFMSLSSYGNSKESSGDIKINMGLKFDIEGKDVLIVEDLIDTGNTLSWLMDYLKSKNASSVKIASLMSKPMKHQHQIDIEYLGIEIEDEFVVGYGLDYAGRYRELPYVGIVSEE